MTDKQKNTEAWQGLKDAINFRHEAIDIFYHVDAQNKVLGYYGISNTGAIETSIKPKIGEDIVVMNGRRNLEGSKDGEIIRLQDNVYKLRNTVIYLTVSSIIIILMLVIALLYSHGV
jgi:hypothetical protein